MECAHNIWLFGHQLDKQLNVRALAVWPSARLTNKLEFWLFGPQLDKRLNVRALAVWPSARLETINKQLPSLFGGEPKVLLLGLVYYLVNTDLLNKRLVGKNIQLHNQFKIVTRIHLIKQINFVARL